VASIKRNQIVAAGALLIVLLLVLAASGAFPLSVISSGNTYFNPNDGQAYFVSSVANNLPGEQVVHVYTGQEVGNYTLANGTVIWPKTSYVLSLSPNSFQCEYQMLRQERGWPFTIYAYYDFSGFTRISKVKVSANKGGIEQTQYFDNALTVSTLSFTDPDGKGKVTVQSQGGFVGAKECPSLAGNYVMLEDGRILQKSEFDSCVLLYPLSFAYCNDYSAAVRTQFSSSGGSFTPQISKSVGTFPVNLVAVPVMTVTASSEWFDAQFYSAPVEAKPSLVDFVVANGDAGQASTATARVRNVGQGAGIFSITINGAQQGGTGVLQPNQEQQLFFSLINPPVAQKQSVQWDACAVYSSQSSGGASSCLTRFSEVAPSGTPNQCGNKWCQSDLGENSQTCPADCAGVITCSEGYTPKQDSMGNQYCEKIPGIDGGLNWTLVAVVGILLAGGLAALFAGKRK